MTNPKVRADQALVDAGLAENRTRAKALIMAGLVLNDTVKIDKPGQLIGDISQLRLKGKDHPWVSRGGLKLAHGLTFFELDIEGHIVLDIGASTGGFTDVSLKNGAAKVYAVDVGHGQIDWKLRNDPRVIVMEKMNARYLTRNEIPEPINLIVCDASFISLKTVLPAAMDLVADDAFLIALIKPQFEVGRDQVGKKGVVRDPELHEEVKLSISNWIKEKSGWSVRGIVESPILGPQGNKEFLIGASYEAP